MSYNIEILEPCKKEIKHLSKRYKSFKEDLEELYARLQDNPFLGTDLGNGVHKIRMSITSKSAGKRGGARVISYVNVVIAEEKGDIFLLSIYDKSSQSTISDKRINELLSQIQ